MNHLRSFPHLPTKNSGAGGCQRAAINRAMKIIPGNAVVSVLTTSHRILNANTVGHPARASPAPGTGNPTSSVSTASDEEAAKDIFVAYEWLRNTVSVPTSTTTNDGSVHATPEGSGKSAGANLDRDRWNAGSGGWRTRKDEYRHTRGEGNSGRPDSGLIVTVSPFLSISGGQREDFSSFSSYKGNSAADQDVSAAMLNRAQTKAHRGREKKEEETPRWPPRSPPTQPSTPIPTMTPRLGGKTLSDIAPLPLLVFDTETFHALGELDEAFAFQGGVAEWINRAGPPEGEGDGADNMRCTAGRIERRLRAAADDGASPGSPSIVGVVHHSHEIEWGKRFLRPWPVTHHVATPEDGESIARTASSGRRNDFDRNIRPVDSTASPSFLDACDPRDHRTGDDPPPDEAVEGGTPGQRCGCDSDGCGEQSGVSDQPTGQANTYKWSRLPLEELEALAQADADLFFLPMLLAESHPGEENE